MFGSRGLVLFVKLNQRGGLCHADDKVDRFGNNSLAQCKGKGRKFMFYMFYGPLTYKTLIFFTVQPVDTNGVHSRKQRVTPLIAFLLALLKF